MKRIYTIQLVLIALLFACNDSNDKKVNEIDSEKQSENLDISDSEKETVKTDVLTIDGENIWVRSKPSTGEVVMKLNTGDKCEIIEKGKKEQIRDMVDYWYKVSFNGKEGWVYGSQTNLKTNEEAVLEDFKVFLQRFVKHSQGEKSLIDFIHKQIGVYTGNNPGVMCSASHDRDSDLKLSDQISAKNIFDKTPKGDFCEGYPDVKSGFYFKEISKSNLPKFGSYEEDGNVLTHTVEIPVDIDVKDFMQVTVISDEYHNCYLYFLSIEFKWYFVCVDFCDCSA